MTRDNERMQEIRTKKARDAELRIASIDGNRIP